MKVAIIHYWLVTVRGGERVLEALCEIFPEADIFTHVYDSEAMTPEIRRHKVITTFIQKLPSAKSKYQNYLPLMPMALEQLDLREYDLVISSESGPAKGVITRPGSLHICYCHTPMRYVWDMYHDYRNNTSLFKRILLPPLIHYLRLWDYISAGRVDHFIANSHFVAGRIGKHYRRNADVIHPPVATSEFSPTAEHEDFYLVLGQLVTYKRVDIAVNAFNRLNRRLVVIGEGEMLKELRHLAGPNVEILGRQPFSFIKDQMRKCRALIFPGLEDFGIVPVEAMACGKPVLAYKGGGALETIIDGVTGLFFEEQTSESLMEAVLRFENLEIFFDAFQIAAHARTFDKEIFKKKFSEYLEKRYTNS